jgi:DNA-3-methyladenine glycosylase
MLAAPVPTRGARARDPETTIVSRPLPLRFYRRPVEVVARALLGCRLVRVVDGRRLEVRIVETEAYLGQPDRASHAWAGRRTPRNESLYRPGGCAYVYFVYGMHHCLNVVTGDETVGAAVLIRAAEPLAGLERMAAHRGITLPPRPGGLAGGPGRLCQALAIDRRLDGVSFSAGPLRILSGTPIPAHRIAVGPRIGIDYAGAAAAWPLRFAIRGHPDVSRPAPPATPSRRRSRRRVGRDPGAPVCPRPGTRRP